LWNRVGSVTDAGEHVGRAGRLPSALAVIGGVQLPLVNRAAYRDRYSGHPSVVRDTVADGVPAGAVPA